MYKVDGVWYFRQLWCDLDFWPETHRCAWIFIVIYARSIKETRCWCQIQLWFTFVIVSFFVISLVKDGWLCFYMWFETKKSVYRLLLHWKELNDFARLLVSRVFICISCWLIFLFGVLLFEGASSTGLIILIELTISLAYKQITKLAH